MKKRITAMTLALALVMGTVAAAAGTEKTISVTPMSMNVNGQTVIPTKSDGTPAEVFSYEGATYVPLRYLSELLGITVNWDKDDPSTAKLTNVLGFSVSGGQTYTGTCPGVFGDDVKATVTVDGGKILSIEVEHKESKGFGAVAIEKLKTAIVEQQSLNLDTVTGATVSSAAVIVAVRNALKDAGVDMTALNRKEKVYPAYENTTVDTVVVGGGAAGMEAAVELAKGGQKVILLEKQGILGGNTLRASTWLQGVGSNAQKKAGLDSPDEAAELTKKFTNAKTDPEYVKVAVENSGYLIDMVIEGGGALTKVHATNPRAMVTENGSQPGPEIVLGLENQMKKYGVDYRLNHRATEIVMKDGKASGVVVETKGGNYTVSADNVILATGGFAASKEMLAEYVPQWAEAGTTNSAGMTGDGHMMAKAVGAAFSSMDQISANPTTYNNGAMLLSLTAIRSMGAMMVNNQGKRFTCETDITGAGLAMLQQDQKEVYFLFDQSIADRVSFVQEYVDRGYFTTADTIGDLATQLGLDPATLTETVDTFWGYVEAGEDAEFGNNMLLCAYDQPKFYAAKVEPAVHGTYGGVVITTEGQALNEAGHIIPGLYAVGCVADMRLYTNNATVGVPGAFAYEAAHHILGK